MTLYNISLSMLILFFGGIVLWFLWLTRPERTEKKSPPVVPRPVEKSQFWRSYWEFQKKRRPTA